MDSRLETLSFTSDNMWSSKVLSIEYYTMTNLSKKCLIV